ncbi:hypothetical protein [Thiolapillus sp.]
MKTLWISTLLIATPIAGMSQVLLIDAIQDEQKSSVPRPAHGTTMSEVEHRFGAPRAKHGPVGDPPITRWDYTDFSVYFEYDKVLTSVLKREKVTGQP